MHSSGSWSFLTVSTPVTWEEWDGFRCLAFKDGNRVELRSKSGRSLSRYFPELVEVLATLRAKTFVLDGEITVPAEGVLSFDALLQRIHLAKSRVLKLAKETPAMFVLFDLLVDDRGQLLATLPLDVRITKLKAFINKYARSAAMRKMIR